MADPFQEIRITSFNPVTKEKTETVTHLLREFCDTKRLSFVKINKQIKQCAKEKRAFVVSVSCELTYMFEMIN